MNDIKNMLVSINVPTEGMALKKKESFFWGKSYKGDVVYGIESKNKNLIPISQVTKYLKICLNNKFNVSLDGNNELKNLSLIILKQEGIEFLDLFIRLTESIDKVMSDEELLSYFLSLKDLFSNESKKTFKELQGMYGELYAMIYLKEKFNIDIAKYYQSGNKEKFDFSITETKKIEIKTTTLPTRIHHFKSEQLNIFHYNIIVVSVMLQKDDAGLSLFELVEKAKIIFENNLKFLIHMMNCKIKCDSK